MQRSQGEYCEHGFSLNIKAGEMPRVARKGMQCTPCYVRSLAHKLVAGREQARRKSASLARRRYRLKCPMWRWLALMRAQSVTSRCDATASSIETLTCGRQCALDVAPWTD